MKGFIRHITVIYICLAAGLIYGFGSEAMAAMDDTGAWDDSDLILAIYKYDYEGNEIVINLGDVSGMDFTASDVTLGQISGLSSWADLRMEVFGYAKSTYSPYFGTISSDAPSVITSAYQMWEGAMLSVYGGYTLLDTDENNIVIHAASGNTDTIGNNMDMNYSGSGAYAGLNADADHGQARLDSLDEGGTIQMYLYKFNTLDVLDPDDDGDSGTPYVGIIEIKSNGEIVLNPSQTVNNPPVASDDSFNIISGETATQARLSSGSTLLSNDIDPDGDSLTVNTTAVNNPANGLLTLNANGTFSYTHDGSETTTDSFTYEINDGNGGTDQATVYITIISQNEDSDLDGMPNGWEILYGLDPFADDSGDDEDGDGFSNLTEFIRGTLPNDHYSHPPRVMPWLPLLLGDD